ncbi:MAG: hypothetical protein HY301_12980 [Verrucomicrobia bacterium]|nr:hypothetical protein [Verrucomicrobiota bacterium]
MKKTIALATLIVLAGCSSTPTEKTEKPPDHMKRVQFIAYDNIQRPMTASLEVFTDPPARKHKIIALITCEGAYHEEIVMTKAILFKARQLGADAVIKIPESTAKTGSGTLYGFHSGGRSVFRANAIVFE